MPLTHEANPPFPGGFLLKLIPAVNYPICGQDLSAIQYMIYNLTKIELFIILVLE